MNRSRPIDTAPRDGTLIEVIGRRFMTGTRYTATAVWASRKCPALVEGWFPPEDDGNGPYEDVRRWRNLKP